MDFRRAKWCVLLLFPSTGSGGSNSRPKSRVIAGREGAGAEAEIGARARAGTRAVNARFKDSSNTDVDVRFERRRSGRDADDGFESTSYGGGRSQRSSRPAPSQRSAQRPAQRRNARRDSLEAEGETAARKRRGQRERGAVSVCGIDVVPRTVVDVDSGESLGDAKSLWVDIDEKRASFLGIRDTSTGIGKGDRAVCESERKGQWHLLMILDFVSSFFFLAGRFQALDVDFVRQIGDIILVEPGSSRELEELSYDEIYMQYSKVVGSEVVIAESGVKLNAHMISPTYLPRLLLCRK